MCHPVLPMVGCETSKPESVWKPGIHVGELDGVRGLAILIVTLYRFGKEIPMDTWLGNFLHTTVRFGDRGVDLFFVLSGFLITGVLLDTRMDPHFFRNFIARRTLRIFPLYFASLFAFLFVIPAVWPQHPFGDAIANQFYLWTYLANVRIAVLDQWCFGSLDHFWSLAVEEHFYLLWPVAVFLMGLRRTLIVSIVCAFVFACSRIAFAATVENGIGPNVLSFFRFDGLLLGAAIATLARYPLGIQRLRSISMVGGGVMLIIGILLGIYTDRFLTISHSVWAIMWSCFLIVVLSSSSTTFLARNLRSRFLRTLGRYSYAMYVFQNPLIPLAAPILSAVAIQQWIGGGDAGIVAHLIYTAAMTTIVFAMAVLSWHLLEKHCLRLKRYFEAARPTPLSMVDKV